MDDVIQIGDKVKVHFPGHSYTVEGEVMYVPQASGDDWIIHQSGAGIVYVNAYERMYLLAKNGWQRGSDD